MKRYIYIGFYLIFSGIAIAVLAVKTLLTEESGDPGIGETMRLASEFITAVFCIISGGLLAAAKPGGRRLSLFALGMLFYSLVNKSGYYRETEQNKWLLVTAAMALCAIISLVILLMNRRMTEYKGKARDTATHYDE